MALFSPTYHSILVYSLPPFMTPLNSITVDYNTAAIKKGKKAAKKKLVKRTVKMLGANQEPKGGLPNSVTEISISGMHFAVIGKVGGILLKLVDQDRHESCQVIPEALNINHIRLFNVT